MSPTPDPPARVLGRYRLAESASTDATVVQALDLWSVRLVDVELFRHAGPEVVERLEREAMLLASVSHPNVLEVHEPGVADGGLVYRAREPFDGRRLSALLGEPWTDGRQRLVNVASQVLAGLRGGTTPGWCTARWTKRACSCPASAPNA